MSDMRAFESIESFRHLVDKMKRHADYHNMFTLPTVAYRGTVKLHGTNAGIEVDTKSKSVSPQGRNRKLAIESDNFGFAAFAYNSNRVDIMLDIANTLNAENVIFYGEWIGTGIQKGVGISTIPRQFVIFSAVDCSDGKDEYLAINVIDSIIGPVTLERMNKYGIYLISQVPTYDLVIDFNNLEPAVTEIERLTLAVEDACPWAAMHGVEGVGEGIVWVPVGGSMVAGDSKWWFKSKGLKHKATTKGEKARLELAPEVRDSLSALVSDILPEWRLEQGFSALRESGKVVDRTSIGDYIKWIHKDILKEEVDRITANNVEWKAIVGLVSTRAKNYYLENIDKMVGL